MVANAYLGTVGCRPLLAMLQRLVECTQNVFMRHPPGIQCVVIAPIVRLAELTETLQQCCKWAIVHYLNGLRVLREPFTLSPIIFTLEQTLIVLLGAPPASGKIARPMSQDKEEEKPVKRL